MESSTEGKVINTSKIDGNELEVDQLHCWEELSWVVHCPTPEHCSARLCGAEVLDKSSSSLK